jgi:hypothetical protein
LFFRYALAENQLSNFLEQRCRRVLETFLQLCTALEFSQFRKGLGGDKGREVSLTFSCGAGSRARRPGAATAG